MARYVVYSNQKLGSEGSQVSAIQESLPQWALSDFLKVDGIFGSQTQSAVKAFQQGCGLSMDGVVGVTTAQALGVWADLTKGFDVSHWNTILWDEIPNEYTFCNLKATEGLTYKDSSFQSNVVSATRLEMSIGAYHFTKFENSPYMEAAWFLETVGAYKSIERLYLDLEYRMSGLTSEAIWKWVSSFLAVISGAKPNCRVGVYTSKNYMSEVGLQKFRSISQYDLWAADWGNQPYVYPWKNWDTWQYTSKGTVDFCEGDLDLNYRVLGASSH